MQVVKVEFKLSNLSQKQVIFLLFTYIFKKKIGETNLRVIVGGGDGSIMWAVQEMISAHIDFQKCVIGTIPFGTGNDFSRVLGWGGNIGFKKPFELN